MIYEFSNCNKKCKSQTGALPEDATTTGQAHTSDVDINT